MKISEAWMKIPILDQMRGYQMAWIKSDLAAGLSVAAVSLPTAIAYPAIAGLPTETGLFATIFSLIGYALFGPSRQLMVGPDTATCIMLASILTTLGAISASDREAVSIALTLAVGGFCFIAGAARLGFLANFLSRPILVGFLAGISISLLIGQMSRLTAVPIQATGLIGPIVEMLRRLPEVHLPTFLLGMGTLVALRLARSWKPNLPAQLVVILICIGLSASLDLASHGVAVLGRLPKIAFVISAPSWQAVSSANFFGGALAIMLVGFGSGIVTARSFAMKRRSDTDADRELVGFGAANIASGLFGGFPVTASDSRSAINFAMGGKTQVTALIAAGSFAAAVAYVGGALAYLPMATLAAILVSAAIDLIDLKEFRTLLRLSPVEFCFAVVTTLAVIVVGVLQGVFISITATLAHLLWSVSRPRLALLGRMPGSVGLYKLHRYPQARAIPGLTVVALESALVFFNADFVKHRLLKIAKSVPADEKWFILDAAALNILDSTGVEKLREVEEFVAARGMTFGIADLNSNARRMVDRAGLGKILGEQMMFASAESAAAAFEASHGAAA
jgi:high affinity sulfate transporter 1